MSSTRQQVADGAERQLTGEETASRQRSEDDASFIFCFMTGAIGYSVKVRKLLE